MRRFPWVKQDEVGVVLTGGLGNQIFQLVAGLSFANRHQLPLVVVDRVLEPWSAADGAAELFSLFDLKGIAVRIEPEESPNSLGIRATQWGIASCSSDHNRLQWLLRRAPSRLAEAIDLSFSTKGTLRPQLGTGYDSSIDDLAPGRLLIGYFQSYKYLQDWQGRQVLQNRLRTHTLDSPSRQLHISLHVRRGDYRRNPQFGLLARGYYERALAAIRVNCPQVEEVRLFSADIPLARDLLEEFQAKFKLTFSDSALPSATGTLLEMRSGVGLIAANSSLSYWAAMLSDCHPTCIAYPTPWFKDSPTPNSLVPSSWQAVASDFE